MVNNGPNLINIVCERPLKGIFLKIVYWKCLAVFSIPFKYSFVAPDCGSLLMVLLRSNVFYELWTMKVPLVCLRSGLSIKSKRGIILILTQTYISNGCHRPRGQIWAMITLFLNNKTTPLCLSCLVYYNYIMSCI